MIDSKDKKERDEGTRLETNTNYRDNRRRGSFRKKVCRFCGKNPSKLAYREVDILKRFISDRGKILPRRITGTCSKHQRHLSLEIKRARALALLPFSAE